MTDEPITEDPKALAEYLVAKAMEALHAWQNGLPPLGVNVPSRGFREFVRERMNNAAQTILTEVEVLRDDSLMWQDGLSHCRAVLEGCVKERDAAIARAERAEAALAALREDNEHIKGRLLSGDSGCVEEAIRWAMETTDTAAAAEAYRARIVEEATGPLRAEALESAADAWREIERQGETAAWLRARAAEERGGR